MFELPTYIEVDDKQFNIRNKGDYRVILDCFVALNDIELDEQLRVLTCMIIFYQDLNSIDDIAELDKDTILELVDKMYFFFNCNEKSIGATKPYRLIDWEKDTQLIASSINKVANLEVRSLEYLHWWTFMGYYLNIGEGVLSNVVSIRDKIVRGKKLESYEKEFMHDNPHYFDWEWKTQEQIEEEKLMRELWNG